MRTLSAVCLASLVLLQLPAAAALAAPASAVVDKVLAARIDAVIAPHYKADQPGATVLVTKDGKTLLRKAYGMADVAAKVAMKEDASLRIGSITKQFTAVGILLLAEEGKLALTDPVSKHLRGYPALAKEVTIEHLLTHTSGIPSFTGKIAYMGNMAKDMGVDEMIDSFKNDPLEFTPGAKFAYNNSGYFLLGAIIEKLSGQTYAQFVEQRIFVPLGMTTSAYEGFERSPAQRAAGHSKKENGFVPAAKLSMSQPYAAGSLVSSVDDLARWDAAISQGKLLKPDSWKKAFTPYILPDGKSTGYGYGWGIGKLRGTPMISHGGGINGFSTFALRLPEQKVYVAVLTNLDGGMTPPQTVAQKAAAVAIGNPYPEFKAIAVDGAALDAFAGSYKIDDKTASIVRRDGDQLTMQRSGRGPVPLQAFATDRFFIKDSLSYFKFDRNVKGEVTQLTLHDDGTETVYPRTGGAPVEPKTVVLPRAALDSYAGRYQLAPGFVLELTRDGDNFYGQATGQGKFQLKALSDKLFDVKEIGAQVRFDSADQLVLSQGGQEVTAKRIK